MHPAADTGAARRDRLVDRLGAAAFAAAALWLLLQAARRCWQSDLRALAATLQDDSFYYLLPAFRLHATGLWTFDGEHASYGFQPLFGLLLAALGGLFDDRFAFLRAAVFLCYLLATAAALLLGLAVRALLQPCGALRAAVGCWLAASLLLFDPPVLGALVTLKENSLCALLLAAALLAAVQARRRPSALRFAWLGALCGLGLLARLLPSTLLVAAVLLAGAGPQQRRRGWLAAAAGLGGVVLPWVLYAASTFGRVLPTSGAVKTAWLAAAHADGTLGQHLLASLAEVPAYAAAALRFACGLPSRLHAIQPVDAGAASWLLPLLLALLLLSVLLQVVGSRRHLLRRDAAARLVPLGLAAAFAGTLCNPLLLDAGDDATLLYYAQWYVVAEPVLLAALAALALAGAPQLAASSSAVEPAAASSAVEPAAGPGAVAAPARRPQATALPWLLAATAALVLLFAGLVVASGHGPLPPFAPRPDSMVHQTIAMIERANATLPAGARLAAANAGVAGFFAERTLLNLDGLANDDVVAARRRGVGLYEYLRQQRVDHVVDVLPRRSGFGGDNPFDRIEIVDALPLTVAGQRGLYLLRVSDERYPDFEPLDGDGVEVWPFRAAAAIGPANPPGDTAAAAGGGGEAAGGPAGRRCFRLHAGGPPLRWFAGGRFAAFHAELVGPPVARLHCRGDGAELLQAAPGPLRLALQGVQVLEVEAAGADLWLVDTAFAESSPLPPPELPAGPYGHGYTAGDAPAPTLQASRLAAAVEFTAASLPDAADVEVLVAVRGDSKLLPGGARVLVALPALAVLPVGSDGSARLPLPAGLQVPELFAQLVCRRDGRIVASSAGLRVRLRE